MQIKYSDIKILIPDRVYDTIVWAGLGEYDGKYYRFLTRDETDYFTMDRTCPYCKDDPPIKENLYLCHCKSYTDLYVDLYPLNNKDIKRLKCYLKQIP